MPVNFMSAFEPSGDCFYFPFGTISLGGSNDHVHYEPRLPIYCSLAKLSNQVFLRVGSIKVESKPHSRKIFAQGLEFRKPLVEIEPNLHIFLQEFWSWLPFAKGKPIPVAQFNPESIKLLKSQRMTLVLIPGLGR